MGSEKWEVKSEEYEVTPADEALLSAFFAEHRETVADEGFTERVMAALPAAEDSRVSEALRLARWNHVLNLIGVLSILVLAADRIVAAFRAFDPDALLVQTMLLLHRLPELLPSAQQLLTFAIATVLLMGLGVKQLASELHHLE